MSLEARVFVCVCVCIHSLPGLVLGCISNIDNCSLRVSVDCEGAYSRDIHSSFENWLPSHDILYKFFFQILQPTEQKKAQHHLKHVRLIHLVHSILQHHTGPGRHPEPGEKQSHN